MESVCGHLFLHTHTVCTDLFLVFTIARLAKREVYVGRVGSPRTKCLCLGGTVTILSWVLDHHSVSSQAYKTVNGDTERYEDRLANMGASAKGQSLANTHCFKCCSKQLKLFWTGLCYSTQMSNMVEWSLSMDSSCLSVLISVCKWSAYSAQTVCGCVPRAAMYVDCDGEEQLLSLVLLCGSVF